MTLSKTKEVGIRLSVKDKEVAERALHQFGKSGQADLQRIARASDATSVSLAALNASIGRGKAMAMAFAGGALSAVASFVSVRAAIEGAKSAMDEFGAVADNAKASGLDAELFQGLAHQAELAGIGYDEFSASLETFNRNAGLAAVNKGKMATALKALNPELLENIRAAKTQEERVRLAADAIRDTADTSRRAALSVALFGASGAKMADAFEGGAASIDATMQKARELGIIVDRDLIARAEELGDEFDTASKVLDVEFKQALINLAPFLIEAIRLAGGLAKAIREITEAADGPGAQMEGTLHENYKRQFDEAAGEAARTLEWQERWRPGQQNLYKGFALNGDASLKVLKAAPSDPDTDVSSAAKKSLAEAEALIKRLRTGTEEYSDTMAKLDQQLASGLIGQETYNRAMAEAVLKRADAVKGDEDYAAALAKVEEALARGIITEQQYTDAVEDMSRRRLEAANTWQAGILLGLDSIAEESRHIGRNIEDSLVSGVERFEDAWIKAMETGKFEWGDLAKQILLDLARMATRQMITGPISGLLSGLFGGGGGLRLGFQAGVGHTGAMIGAAPITRDVPLAMFAGAQRHHAGTDFLRPGEVPFIGMRGEEIGWPDQLRRKYGGAGRGGDVTVYVSAVYNTEGSGLSPDQLRHVFEQNNKALIGQVVPVVRKAIRDGAL